MQNICKLLCAISVCCVSSLLLQLLQLLLSWKKPRRMQGGLGVVPRPWPLCVPARAEKAGLRGSGCRQYFHEMRVFLGSHDTHLTSPLTLSSLIVHAQGGEGCGMVPESSPGACRAWWPRESFFRPSHPSHPSWISVLNWDELGSCKGSARLSAEAGYRREAGTVAVLPGLAVSSTESGTSLRVLGDALNGMFTFE